MDEYFDVYIDGNTVGSICVRQEGLYYCFSCRCRVSMDTVCRVQWGNISLGILVPMGEQFGLETKLPVKRFSDTRACFTVVPNRAILAGRFVPLYPEEPFSYIERLKNTYLTRQNGKIGIVIRESAVD